MRTLSLLLCAALLVGGCGDDGGSGSDGGGPAPTGDGDGDGDGGGTDSSCYQVCDAQAAAESAGGCAFLTVEECKLICDGQTQCNAELAALHDCWLTGTFSCGLFSAESDADCAAQNDAYSGCTG